MRVEGEVVVPRSSEATQQELLLAIVAGALGSTVRITHRDAATIAFRVSGVLPRLSSMGAGHLRVEVKEGETVVSFACSVGSALWGAALAGLGTTGVALWASASASPTALLSALGAAAAGAVLWGLWVRRRMRLRFETLLHNLRYLS
ncbi:MAG: hypothetical protein D6729_06790 [Deltaproteobacteria bacterium]|nr:MAG: hypothetical protein D6729_06790 [Deltaproteobacteria bacterium]